MSTRAPPRTGGQAEILPYGPLRLPGGFDRAVAFTTIARPIRVEPGNSGPAVTIPIKSGSLAVEFTALASGCDRRSMPFGKASLLAALDSLSPASNVRDSCCGNEFGGTGGGGTTRLIIAGSKVRIRPGSALCAFPLPRPLALSLPISAPAQRLALPLP